MSTQPVIGVVAGAAVMGLVGATVAMKSKKKKKIYYDWENVNSELRKQTSISLKLGSFSFRTSADFTASLAVISHPLSVRSALPLSCPQVACVIIILAI